MMMAFCLAVVWLEEVPRKPVLKQEVSSTINIDWIYIYIYGCYHVIGTALCYLSSLDCSCWVWLFCWVNWDKQNYKQFMVLVLNTQSNTVVDEIINRVLSCFFLLVYTGVHMHAYRCNRPYLYTVSQNYIVKYLKSHKLWILNLLHLLVRFWEQSFLRR